MSTAATVNQPDRASALPGAADATARFRYGAVFALAFAIVVFVVAAPAGSWSLAAALALEFAGLLVVIATSRTRRSIRKTRLLAVAGVAAFAVLLVGLGVLPSPVALALGTLLLVVIPLALVNGLYRLLRTRGVTMQTVAGALAIYLMVGLLFASVVGLTAAISSRPYFANGSDGTQSERVYYSFTVMTTTGFGDFTAALPVGRAIAVVEMLTGQLYLVTVIGVLVGHIAAKRGSES